MYYYKIIDCEEHFDMDDTKILVSNKKYEDEELEKLMDGIANNLVQLDEDGYKFDWKEIINVLVTEYDFEEVQINAEVMTPMYSNYL